MPTGDKTNLKQVLRDECLPALGGQSKYYNMGVVKVWLQRRKLRCPAATLNSYLHEFTRDGLVFDAGCGWYSSLATAFTLNQEPVSSLVQELNKTFPLVEFSCWSTEQIKGAMHDLLSRFVTFVNVEADAMESVWEHLRDTGWDAWLNPRGAEAARFAVRERTVVVRRESRKSPSKNPSRPSRSCWWSCASKRATSNSWPCPEFHTMLANLAGTTAHPDGHAHRLCRRPEIASFTNFLETKNQLIPPF